MKVDILERGAARAAERLEETFASTREIGNLERITPPWLRFRILDPRPDRLTAGARLQYSLVLHRFPVRWTTEISEWEPPHRFADFQVRGPYRRWEHTHTFEPSGSGGTSMTRHGALRDSLRPARNARARRVRAPRPAPHLRLPPRHDRPAAARR